MKALSITCLLFVTSVIFSQKITAKLLGDIPLQADMFVGVDDYKSLYYTKDNVFYKQQESMLFQYTDFALGELSTVDILNPLKIVLFYQDTNTAVILDNTLSEIRRINFNTLQDFRTLQYVTTANDSNLWTYNLDTQELEVFDYTRNRMLAKSIPISETVLAQKSNFNFCWLQTDTGILKFNIYGSLMNEYAVEEINTFAEKNGKLAIAAAEGVSYLGNNDSKIQTIDLPKYDVKQLYLDIENLYIYDGKTLYHHQLQLPKN